MEKMKNEKGQYGYIKVQKKKRLLRVCIALIIIIGIYVAGLLIFHTNATIFSVIAAVGSLPAAKLAVAWLILVKYKTPPKAQYDAICSIAGADMLLSDIVLSSTEKLMGIDFLFVHNSKVYGYCSDEKTDLKQAERYLSEYIKREYRIHTLKLFRDFSAFKTMVSGCMQEPSEEKDRQRDEKIRKEILLYCV